ncbi:MAG: hypothetical protein KA419_12210 [Acidobacteria bacterium]|nr:hypothetical protein [Acidobacteriota bacterium]
MIRFRRPRTRWVTAALALAAAAAFAPAATPSAGGRHLELVLETPAYRLEPGDGRPGARRVVLPGWGRTTEPGRPELPVWTQLVQVPAEGEIRVRAVVEGERVLPGFQPVLVGAPSGGGEAGDLLGDGRSPLPPGPFPAAAVEISPRMRLRGTVLARLRACPFRWDAGSGELRVARRMILHVDFETPLQPGDPRSDACRPLAALPPLERDFEAAKRGVLPNRAPDGPSGGMQPEPRAFRAPAGPTTDALKLSFRAGGMARLGYEALAAAGLPAGIDPAAFRVVCQGRDVALRVASDDAAFGPGDAVEFFTEPFVDSYTDTNVYWLTWEGPPGPRIGARDGAPSGLEPAAPRYTRTRQFEENKLWWGNTPGAPENDYWFWEKFTSPMIRSYTLTAPDYDPAAGTPPVFRAVLQGRSVSAPHPNHVLRVSFNAVALGEDQWDGQDVSVPFHTIPPGVLKAGANTVTLESPGAAGGAVDVFYLNRLELSYPSLFRAEGDCIDFTLDTEGPTRVEVPGFGSPGVRVFDVTDADLPVEITGVQVSPEGAGYRAVFTLAESGAHRCVAVCGPAWLSPDSIRLRHPLPPAGPPDGADLLLVTAEDFLESLQPLADLRERQGVRVALVGVEALYDAFNWGIFNPRAVKDFIAWAYWAWPGPRPSYVLFVGDADLDYHDHTGTGRRNRVPVYTRKTFDLGLTPMDNWYACVDGDDPVPDLFQGRLPAVDAAAAAAVVQKVMHYESGQGVAPLRVNLTADNDAPVFQAVSEEVSAFIPETYQRDRVYLSQYTNFTQARNDLFASFNRGVSFSNFVGHGSITNWAGEMICRNSDMVRLADGMPLMFVMSTTCLNAYFAHPEYYSLGEAFLAVPGKGAVACFMSSGLTYDWENQVTDLALVKLVFAENCTLLGPATLRARLEAYRTGATSLVLDTYQLLGDPMTRLRTAPLGDVDGSGAFDASDLYVIAAVLAGEVVEGKPPCRIPDAADFNRNRRLDAQDLAMATALLVGVLPWPIPPA